jgi:hypothetical protein
LSNGRLSQTKVRDATDADYLPRRAPDSVWGSPASGARCAICGTPTDSGQFELELVFASDPDAGGIVYRAHPGCFSKFSDELNSDNPTDAGSA